MRKIGGKKVGRRPSSKVAVDWLLGRAPASRIMAIMLIIVSRAARHSRSRRVYLSSCASCLVVVTACATITRSALPWTHAIHSSRGRGRGRGRRGRGSKGRKVERANQKRAFEPLHLYPLASVTVVPTFLLFLLLSLARGSFGRIIIFLDRFLTVEKDVSFFFLRKKKKRDANLPLAFN